MMSQSVELAGVLGGGLLRFGNSDEGERPPLEAGKKQRLRKIKKT
jgi:hypothetical protein